jgi:FHS family L-fucose permease-like MFS transporter
MTDLNMNKGTQAVKTNYTIPLAIITVLFFIFGFVTNLNDILIPHLKRACQLTDLQSSFVTSAFFGAYFLMSLPAAAILKKTGYRKGIFIGLITMAIGALLFIPAANTRFYLLFLFALSVLASGVTLLQVAANPYVTLLGPPEGAASRLSLMGTLNSLGATLGPFIGGIIILSGVDYSTAQINAMPELERIVYLNNEAFSVKTPYLILTGILLFLGIMILFSKLPEVESEKLPDLEEKEKINGSIFQHSHLILGVIAIFTYVGAEVSVGAFMIRYGQSSSIPGFTEKIGSQFASMYMFAAMTARFAGIFIMPKVSTSRALVFNSSLAIVLIMVSIFSKGSIALWCLVLVGLCNSIMWPAIFPLAISGLGSFTKKGSSFLIMGVVGGAVIPPVIGYLAGQESIGIQNAFVVVALCYAFILFYGLEGYKKKNNTSIS